MPKPHKDKFHSRTVSFIFLGYSITKKDYKLLNLTKYTLFFSRDVAFLESVVLYSPSYPTSIFLPLLLFLIFPVNPPFLLLLLLFSLYLFFLFFDPDTYFLDIFVPNASVHLRRSRPSLAPVYLKDYVCTNIFVSKDAHSIFEGCLLEL